MLNDVDLANPIGIFDSGIGGFSVLRHIRNLLPYENIIYFADQAHVPYGGRSPAEIVQFSRGIVQFLLARHAKMIVVPCNTASAAALSLLRQEFTDVPFVGMEPAVKPAAQQTRSGKVGVLATAGTIESERYGRLMQQYAQHVEVWQDPCFGLVELIESGQIDASETEQYLRQRVEPMLAGGVDTLVLGCTHYPFIRPLLVKIAGERVSIIDPSPAVTRQAQRVLQRTKLLAPVTQTASLSFVTSGDVLRFAKQIKQLLDLTAQAETARWQNGQLTSSGLQ